MHGNEASDAHTNRGVCQRLNLGFVTEGDLKNREAFNQPDSNGERAHPINSLIMSRVHGSGILTLSRRVARFSCSHFSSILSPIKSNGERFPDKSNKIGVGSSLLV